jgi:hypothetical protein
MQRGSIWAICIALFLRQRLSVYPDERTSLDGLGMSVWCQRVDIANNSIPAWRYQTERLGRNFNVLCWKLSASVPLAFVEAGWRQAKNRKKRPDARRSRTARAEPSQTGRASALVLAESKR